MTRPVHGPADGATDPFEPFRRLVSGMAASAGALVESGAAGAPASDQAAAVAALYRSSVEPLRTMLREQRELSDRLVAGLEQLRRLTDDFGVWLDQHRRMVEHTEQLLDPLLEHNERLAAAAAAWAAPGRAG